MVKDGKILYAGPSAGAARRSLPTPPGSTRGAARSCRDWSRRTFIPPTSTSPSWPISTSSIRSNTSRILAACNARLALECGYTAARSGGSLHNIDVWLKKAIEDDLIPGPRLAASGREICGAGGLMDWNPDHLKLGMEGLILLINGPDEGRKAVRKLVKDGVEWIKTYPTGDAAAPDTRRPPHAVHDLRRDGRRRRRGAQLPSQGHRPLPGNPGDQERPPRRLRQPSSTPRSWTPRHSTCC